MLGGTARAQAPAGSDERLRVFLDCPSGGCDRNYIVNAQPFAIWTQDRLDADIHLLITRLGTGSGGDAFTLEFIGQRRLAGRTDTLRVTVPPNSSDDMQRRELARGILLGIAPAAARFVGTDRFDVSYELPDAVATTAPSDRWNLWVYRVRLRGDGSSESRSSDYELGSSFSANRVTPLWKLSAEFGQEYEAQRFTLSDGTDREFALRRADGDMRVIRSLTDHWSVGTRLSGGLSEFRNQDAFAGLDASMEYNLFPWSEATSRQLIALVALGGRFFDYREETLYGRLSETRPISRVVIAGESRLPWGTLDGSLRYTQYLHDTERYNVSFFARSEVRLTRGLSFEVSAQAASVKDQLYLPRGDISDDEVLTRQRALATAYRLSASFGINFTFGSIYNTIVNPRMNEID